MLDVRASSIIYQAQVYYTNLVNSLVISKGLGKARLADWRKADQILGYLQTWNYEPRLLNAPDITNYNYILYALITLCGLNSFPVGSPLSAQPAPTILIGLPGAAGATGAQGPRGFAGLATDFSVISASTTVIVDSFPISSAIAARWDYYVISTANAQRADVLIAQWNAAGTLHTSADMGTDDLVSSTSGISLDVNISGTTVQLIATITSGTWSIYGSRYFIPNNGAGTGPIGNVLTNGYVYIGNASNVATGVPITGAITITNTGVSTLQANVVQNSNISASAAISLSKLAPLSNNQLVVTNGSGVLISQATPSLTTLGFLDATSSVQTQLNSKLTNPLTTIGDILINNASNVTTRLPIGTSGQVLTVFSGVPTWQTFNNFVTVTVNIGTWNMDIGLGGVSNVAISHGLSDITKIRRITVVIVNDSGSNVYVSNDPTSSTGWGISSIDSARIILVNGSASILNSAQCSGAGNRGYIIIDHV